MNTLKCPKCESTDISIEWGDDNHGNYGNVYTCDECHFQWEDGYEEI